MKKYNIIYADPPWSYKDKALAGKRGAICKYPVMSIDDINNLPIKDLADNDCVLFMWVTMPKLNECFDVIKAWGFEYKTVAFTWVKRNKKSPSWFLGMGRWTRANAELCLLATKGKPKRISAAVHSVIDTPIEGHSKKPDEARKRIITLLGDLPRIELFARERSFGWDVWGNEVESDIDIQSHDSVFDAVINRKEATQ
jgi:N6-adenosine-specific RNA methylase IME4